MGSQHPKPLNEVRTCCVVRAGRSRNRGEIPTGHVHGIDSGSGRGRHRGGMTVWMRPSHRSAGCAGLAGLISAVCRRFCPPWRGGWPGEVGRGETRKPANVAPTTPTRRYLCSVRWIAARSATVWALANWRPGPMIRAVGVHYDCLSHWTSIRIPLGCRLWKAPCHGDLLLWPPTLPAP